METELKVFAIVTDLPGFMTETEKFEKENVVKEKYVSSQIVQGQNPARNFQNGSKTIQLPGVSDIITTVMISVVYVCEVKKTILKTI